MGVHKTVNGAYRYRYAPFLISTYYVTGCSPLALPLGELSPQVTERVLQPFSNDKINLCAHTTKIPVDIQVGESQNLQPKRHQELRTFRIISKPLRFIMLRAIQFNDQSGRSIVYPLRPRYARPPLPKGEARGARMNLLYTIQRAGTADYTAVPVNCLIPPAALQRRDKSLIDRPDRHRRHGRRWLRSRRSEPGASASFPPPACGSVP